MILFFLNNDLWIQGVQIILSLAILAIAVMTYRRGRKWFNWRSCQVCSHNSTL